MYGIAVGLVLLGALCGAMIRLMPFVIVLVVAAIIVVVSTWSQSAADILLNVVLALVALQVGYAAGLMVRAMLHSWRHGRTGLFRRRSQRDIQLPTEQRHR